MTLDAPLLVTQVTLRRDAALRRTDDALELEGAHVSARLPAADVATTAILERLAAGPAAEAELVPPGGMQAVIRTQMLLRRLNGGGWLEHAVRLGDVELARLRPLGFGPVRIDTGTVAPAVPRRLSRFALARRDGDVLLVETPLGAHAVELVAPAACALLGLLTAGASAEDAAAASGLPVVAVGAVFDLFAAAGLLAGAGAGDGDTADPERDELRLGKWSQADLMLHATARSGRRSGGYGGTYRFKGVFEPEPTLPEPTGARRVQPAVPDLDAARAADPPLTSVIEARRSVRQHDDEHPITVDQLGELLYRSVRIRQTGGSAGDVLVDRPYPAGGSLGELTFYAVVTRCDGLDPGIWRYAAADHAFEHVADPGPASLEMVGHARAASLMPGDPQVLIVIAARFGRVMWKYESMAYALILKHVGVAYQTMYLVAQAMGLAPCAQGGGSADLFAAATGLDYYTEGSVGEFLIGSRPVAPVLEWESPR